MAEQRKDDKGWLGLLGLLGALGGLAWVIFGKKEEGPPPGGASLEALSVEFHSPGDFFPGSWHTAKVTLRNTGTAPASISDGNVVMNVTPDVGQFGLGGPFNPTIIQPGGQAVFTGSLQISPLAVPGSQNVWTLRVVFDSQELMAGPGDAFMVEVPLFPQLSLVPPVQFT